VWLRVGKRCRKGETEEGREVREWGNLDMKLVEVRSWIMRWRSVSEQDKDGVCLGIWGNRRRVFKRA